MNKAGVKKPLTSIAVRHNVTCASAGKRSVFFYLTEFSRSAHPTPADRNKDRIVGDFAVNGTPLAGQWRVGQP
jgi:hypothetical protein